MQEHSSLANVVARTCFSDLPDDILFRIDYFLRKGGLGVLRLVKKSFAYASRGQYFRANEFAVFRNAAKHANLEILTKVYEFINCNGSEEVGGGGGTSGCGGETAALMKVKNFEAVKRCAVNSKTLAQDKVAVLATLHGWITALNGGQELIKGMLKLINEDSDYGVFCEAAKQVGGLEVMKLLYHWGSDQQKHGMRNAKRFEVRD